MSIKFQPERYANVAATSKTVDVPAGAAGCYIYSGVDFKVNPGASVAATNFAPFAAGFAPYFIECDGNAKLTVGAISGNLAELIFDWRVNAGERAIAS